MSQVDPAQHTLTSGDLTAPEVAELVAREDLLTNLEGRLAQFLDDQRAQLGLISQDTHTLVDGWSPMLMGGKRLRAAFAYWAWRAYGGTPQSQQVHAMYRIGAALELFQAAALFHDDVMDRSDTRRGIPTAHRAFAAAHGSSNFLGDGDQYGLSTAILLGDLSLVASENEFRAGAAEFDPQAREAAHQHFDDMRTVVTVGQFLDVHAQVAPWTLDLDVAEARALKVIETKTASYSVNSPLQIGAALAGASPGEQAQLKQFGIPVGMAYQLVDDLISMFGDPAVTGKPAGDDLKEGKRTVLVIEALRRLSPSDRTVLQEALGNPDLNDAQVTELISLIEGSGAVQAVKDRVAQLSSQGLETLAGLKIDQTARATLFDLTRTALRRLS